MDNPSKITEGGVEYSLGKFDGKSVIYDFPKILIYLNAKGKLLFGEKFRIYDEDKDILLKMFSEKKLTSRAAQEASGFLGLRYSHAEAELLAEGKIAIKDGVVVL